MATPPTIQSGSPRRASADSGLLPAGGSHGWPFDLARYVVQEPVGELRRGGVDEPEPADLGSDRGVTP